MNIAAAIRRLFPAAKPRVDFIVVNRGNGQEILTWLLPFPQPSMEQLEAAWADIEADKAAKDVLWNARVAMADTWAALPVEVRADHAHDYSAIEASLIRGDVAAAKLRIERMQLLPEREPLRAQFLALFPA